MIIFLDSNYMYIFMIFRFVMAHPLPPNHEVDVHEMEPAHPEPAPAPQLPPLPNHLHPYFDDEDEEEEPMEDGQDEEEEPMEDGQAEEEIEEIILFDVDTDDEMDEPELIDPYEAPGSPFPPPPLSDTSSDSEPETEEVATVGTIRQVPLVRRRFPASVHERGGSSSSAPITYELEDLVPSFMRRDIDSLYGKVKVLERQMMVRELEGEYSLSRDKLAFKRIDLLDHDLGKVEHQQDETKSEVKLLGKRFREWDEENIRGENKRLKEQLKNVKMSRMIDHMKNDRTEKDLYEMRCWAYNHWERMIRLGYEEDERSCELIDVLAVYGEKPPPEPRGSPRDPQ